MAGPDLSKNYNGLYKFNYFLFSAGSFVNVVQHNVGVFFCISDQSSDLHALTLVVWCLQLTYINCYFDKGNETDMSKWTDPVDAANMCTQVF